MSAELHDFAHAIGVSFEANLAYSIVVQLGNLAGASINGWIESERLRVVPAMCETPSFDEARFTRELEEVRDRYKKHIGTLNWFCVRWSFVAAVAAASTLILLPFDPHAQVGLWGAIFGTTALFGGVAAGISGTMYLRWKAGTEMRQQSKAYEKAVEMFKAAPAEKVDAATAALKKKIEAERLAQLPSPTVMHH